MTTLEPDHFGHNIRMVIKTKAAITAPESSRKPQEVQTPSNSSFTQSNSVTLAVKQSIVTLQVTVKFSTVCNNMLKRRSYEYMAGKNTVL